VPPGSDDAERRKEERQAMLCIAAIAVMAFIGFGLLIVAIIADWN
jgi:hypothetical protein